MYTLAELKPGRAITVDGEPYLITWSQFSKQGRQGGVMATKMKNLKTGSVIQKTFQGSDKLPPADIGHRHVQYLYGSADARTFMDLETYDQFDLTDEVVGEASVFLVDGMECDALMFEGHAIGIQLPVAIVQTVKETTPGVKGDTATGGTKPATLESGVVINVPLFITEGDKVKINTETQSYIERA